MSDENEYSEHYEPRPPEMSTGSKVLLIILSVFGVLCVACCGGVIYFVNKYFNWEIITDPVAVRELQHEILEMQVPPRFDPLEARKMRIYIARIELAIFQARGGELSQLAVIRMKIENEDVTPAEAKAEINKQNPNPDQLGDATTETRSYTVDGKEITVTFSHGTLKPDENAPADQVGKEWYSVASLMSVDGAMVMFIVTGPEEEFDEQEIENMINSMRFPLDE